MQFRDYIIRRILLIRGNGIYWYFGLRALPYVNSMVGQIHSLTGLARTAKHE